MRNVLSAILRKHGHEVDIASEGKEGLEKFEEEEFDLVFTDLGMPGMSGWEVAEKIKNSNRMVPVAIITGWTVELNEAEMKEKHIDLVIQKPFNVRQVVRLVQEGMVLRDQLRDQFRAA